MFGSQENSQINHKIGRIRKFKRIPQPQIFKNMLRGRNFSQPPNLGIIILGPRKSSETHVRVFLGPFLASGGNCFFILPPNGGKISGSEISAHRGACAVQKILDSQTKTFMSVLKP